MPVLIAILLVCALGLAGSVFWRHRAKPQRTATTAIHAAVAAGHAQLVDVREPSAWPGGVVAGAVLLPLSDLENHQPNWKAFLAAHPHQPVFVYGQSPQQAALVATRLRAMGVEAAAVGSYSGWSAAGLPVCRQLKSQRRHERGITELSA